MVPRMVVGSIADAAANWVSLRPEQVLGGAPKARTKNIGISPDGCLSCGLWECTAGRFRWVFHSDEIIHVLEGSARISSDGGVARTVNAGDVVYFPRGLVTEWEVPVYLKKLAVHRSMPNSLRARIADKVQRVLRRVR